MLVLLLFISQINKLYAHQPFEIIKSSNQETVIDLSDASVSHAFYGEFESDNEEIIFNLNSFSDNILKFSILIPDREPENQLTQNYLPELTITKIDNSENQNIKSIEEIYKANSPPSTFYEPYSQMNLIRVISHQEIMENDIKVKVTLKSNGLLRYVFSVGSKEIFSSIYASGDTKYFNSPEQRQWYIKPTYENKENLSGKKINSSTQMQETIAEQLKKVENHESRFNLSTSVLIFSGILIFILTILVIYIFKVNKNKT
ncbi:MAG: hypothetical protein CL758_06425 [Chloroflexi bacterium]|nr:hypothetical protein [Chloroflexota bacterium]